MAKYGQRFKHWLTKQLCSPRSEDGLCRGMREALADVQAGRVFEHYIVQEWIHRLGTDLAEELRLPLSTLKWSSTALCDLIQLYQFLSVWNQSTALRTIQNLATMAAVLRSNPQQGEYLTEIRSKDIWRMTTGHYEFFYSREGSMVYLLRLRHIGEYRHHDH